MPADSRLTKERILKAAETLFAEHGLDGVSLRTIAAKAGVQIALLHYHFGTKDELYRAIWATRYAPYHALRDQRLQVLDYTRDQEHVVREIIEIFLAPLQLMLDTQARSFVRVIGREVTDPNEPQHGVVRDFLDVPAKLLLAALKRALPELSAADLAWGYQFMVGVFSMHALDGNRTTRLSEGLAVSGDVNAATPVMIEFIVGGWLRLARSGGPRRATKKQVTSGLR